MEHWCRPSLAYRQIPAQAKPYRIGPDDVLEIKVFQSEELSTKEQVGENGVILMPLIGAIEVAGLTPQEAEQVIARKLGEDYLQNPQVDIFVADAASKKVTVIGAVKTPGVFPLKGRATLLEAVAQAQGVTPVANKKEVIIFRTVDNQQGNAYVVNLLDVQSGKLADPVLLGNDKIMVPESGSAVFLKGITDTLRGFVALPASIW